MNHFPDEASNLDFTHRAKVSFIRTVKDPYFRDSDYDLIYDLLKTKMRIVPFGDYLKRYIYTKAEMKGDYQSISLADYQDILCDEFADRSTPCSFAPTTLRMRNAAKNWLEQQTVNRNVVLLLGFGLGMSVDDVNGFLTKALQEYELNAKDPFESLCWYCYRYGVNYLKFEALWDQYQSLAGSGNSEEDPYENTISFKKKLSEITHEKDLMPYLLSLPVLNGEKRQSVSARRYFDRLYAQTKELVAEILTEQSKDLAGRSAERLEERLAFVDRYYDCEKLQKIKDEKGKFTEYTADDIGPADIEDVILSAVPKDKNGNLVSLRNSSLEKQFFGKRLTRQRLADIVTENNQITRYDLLTLYFFVYSQTSKAKKKERYLAFIDTANRMLSDCCLGPVYVANPYECFLLICLLSDDPFGTYADVWELSYST